jgi:hypothetical protein
MRHETPSGLPAISPHKGGEDSWHSLAPIEATAVPQVKPLPLVGRGWGGVFASYAVIPIATHRLRQ